MPGTSSELSSQFHVGMEIECPQCGEKMVLHVGLMGDPKNIPLECLGCRNEIVPLVPGPIVGGPFPMGN